MGLNACLLRFASLYLLDTSSKNSQPIEVGFFSIDCRHLLDQLRYPCMHFNFLYFAFFFPLRPLHLVFLVSLWFLVLLIPSISLFCLSPVKIFGLLCPLTIVSKRGRILRIDCHSSGGVIDLGGELHIKGKKGFYVTNLRGELVWYTLILLYILYCVSFGFVTFYIHNVLFLYLMMMYVFHSLSHMCCFFSLFIHMFLVYLTYHYFPHGTLMYFV